jgi:hypothetical protein
MGDRLRVVVSRVDLESRRIDFRLAAQATGDVGTGQRRGKGASPRRRRRQ